MNKVTSWIKRAGKTACVWALVIMLVSAYIAPLAVFAESAKVAKATNVFTSADTKSTLLSKLRKGTAVEVISTTGSWAYIEYEGVRGYTKLGNLKRVKEAPTVATKGAGSGKALTTADLPAVNGYNAVGKTKGSVSVYKTPSASGQKIGTLSRGAKVIITGAAGDFYRISAKNGEGYIKADGVKIGSTQEQDTPPAAASNQSAPSSSSSSPIISSPVVTTPVSKDSSAAPLRTTQTAPAQKAAPSMPGPADPETVRTVAIENKPASAYTTINPGVSGAQIVKLQTRLQTLGYFGGDLGGNYGPITEKAVKEFQKAAGLTENGVATAELQSLLYSSNAPKAPAGTIPINYDNAYNDNSPATPNMSSAVVKSDWFAGEIQNVFSLNTVAVITDIKTGISWREVRRGGYNHADCQPLTPADTAKMKEAYGGSWSWDRRAVWVSVGGKRYAASINGMPHGSGSITTNNFPGHHCIHFTNSRTHGTNQIDKQMQTMIEAAFAEN